jgi:hypothetical protein
MSQARGNDSTVQHSNSLPRTRLRGIRAFRQLAEAVGLLTAPFIVFFGLHVRAMPRTLMIDPFFYGAYALDGSDLLQRFGTGNYFWPRVGFILPDSFFVTLFGPLAGFFTFRYVLALVATIPVYVLFRQLMGRAVGWIAVLVVLTAPVVLTAWGTDYPDSSAVSYLMAGGACLFIKPTTPRGKWLLPVVAGLFFGLAINSQVVAALTVAGVVTGRVVTGWPSGGRKLLADLSRVVLGAVGTTMILVVCTAVTLGHWDIFRPTIHALIQYRDPKVYALFHSTTWRWLIDDIYVMVPPALVVAWLIAAWPALRRSSVPAAEVGFAVATAVAFALHAFLQFVGNSWTLEYYLYTSMLWATVCPLLVFTALRVFRGVRSHRPTRAELAVVGGSLLGIPLVARAFRDQIQLEFRVAVLLVGVAGLGALIARYGRRLLILRVAGVVCTVGALTLLVVGLPVSPTIFPGQIPYFTPDYGAALFADGQAEVDKYAIFAGLHEVVPTWSELPGGLVTWAPPAHSDVLNVATAQYLWLLEALPPEMPHLDHPTLAALIARRPRVLVMLSDTGAEFASAQQALSSGGFANRIVRQATLRSGADVLWVRVLELTAQPGQ